MFNGKNFYHFLTLKTIEPGHLNHLQKCAEAEKTKK